MGLLLLLLLASVAPAFLTGRWIGLGYGLLFLLLGLLALQQHVLPFGEDRWGLGGMVLAVMGLLTGLGIAARTIWDVGHDRFFASRPPSPWLSWAMPTGALVAVLAFHWLANRLAGATPAWLVHLGVAGPAMGVAALVGLMPVRAGLGQTRVLLLASCLGLTLLVVHAGARAIIYANLASTEADGAPYCLLTFAGREHPRLATQVLELSPLVSRSGGRSFAEDAAWLVVGEPRDPRRLRLRGSAFQEDRNARGASCVPAPLP
ncbi:hypothetical protein [Sphingomonas sp.]|jgi:hypothetical protein|uniref:hypothetical protein n=1 Tax=Sphingomonas sp. TaxID=28214 RepID=UPI002D7FD29B|nr:hypothetical protein [Sphingomonas sp.]HEU0045054.1 hypothetical protein [Sphingomonas sp.]